MRVLCVDDHAIFRQGVKQILLQHDRQTKIGEAATAEQAMQLVRESRWDVAILDLSLPDRSGLHLLTELKQEQPELPVLILSMHADDEYALRAFIYIARQSPRLVPAAEVAGSIDAPRNYLSKTLGVLARAGFLDSTRGASGGFRIAAGSAARPLSDLVATIEAREPRGRVTFMSLQREPGRNATFTVRPRIDPSTGEPFVLDYTHVFVDPATGAELGRRDGDGTSLSWRGLMPFLVKFHYSLHLPQFFYCS